MSLHEPLCPLIEVANTNGRAAAIRTRLVKRAMANDRGGLRKDSDENEREMWEQEGTLGEEGENSTQSLYKGSGCMPAVDGASRLDGVRRLGYCNQPTWHHHRCELDARRHSERTASRQDPGEPPRSFDPEKAIFGPGEHALFGPKKSNLARRRPNSVQNGIGPTSNIQPVSIISILARATA